MRPRINPGFPKLVWWLALLALLPAIAVQSKRIHSALTTTVPVQTSGCEEESFYGVWRAKHGLATYTDSSKPPYAGQYFNWLFYQTYGLATRGHADEEIPRWGRLFTLGGSFVALLLAWWTFTHSPGSRPSPAVRRWGLLAALGLLSSPLFGWWLVTLRPDVWALALEIGSVAWFLGHYPRHRWRAVAGAVVLAYAAWAFKQSNVAALATVVLFLACKRERLAAAFAALAFALAIAGTLLGSDPTYRSAFSEVATRAGFDAQLGWSNLFGALVRALPVAVLPVYALGFRPAPRTTASRFDALPAVALFALLGLGVSASLAFVTSFKIGASTNYYFTAAFFATLLGIHARHTIGESGFARFGDALVALAVVAACVLAVVQLRGARGMLNLDAPARELAQRSEIWRNLPHPRFSADRRLALPWLNLGGPHFVPGYNYESDRRRGRAFEHDGIGGLIREGYFAALMLPADTEAPGSYDGAALEARYTPSAKVAGMVVYLRKKTTQ